MQPRRTTLVLSIFAASTLLAACGTSTASNGPGESGSAATSGAQGTPSAATTPAPGATLGNVGGAANGLSNLSSYKITMAGSFGTGPFNVEFIRINGTSPALSFSETAGSAVVFRVIEIGTDNWVDQGTGTFVKNSVPNSSLEGMMGAFDPGTIFASASKDQNLSALDNKGVESKNGVQAVHLHGDQNTQLPAGASPIPAGATIDLWVAADGGYLVALEVVGMPNDSGGSSNFSIEVSNINDSSLKVLPPS
jgi:hypothetical protein